MSSSYSEQHQQSLQTPAAFPEGHPHFDNASAGKVSPTELNNYVTLFTTRHSDPLTVSFEAYCSGLTAVEISIDFDGTTNFEPTVGEAFAATSSDSKFVALIRPFQRTYIGVLKLADKSKRASLKLKFEWKYEKASDDEIAKYFAWSLEKTKKEVHAAAQVKFPTVEQDPDNVQVNQLCAEKGVKFVDLDFQPRLASLDCCDDAEEEEDLKMIEWKRPSEFMKGDISVFEGTIAAADIIQGALGDCWYLSALAAMTEFPQLVRDVFIDSSEKYNPNGAYNLQFYKNGLDRVVRVDDFFPCNAGPMAGPKYSRCNGNELWVMLAEKAFAKMHGSYATIVAGWTSDALMDLTGAPCKTYRFDDSHVTAKLESGELWKELCYSDEEKFLLTATTPGEDKAAGSEEKFTESSTGLVPGHAYTLVSCIEVQGHKLCRLRNPWGSMEWNGAWSDHSDLWTEEMKSAVEKELSQNKTSTEIADADADKSAATEKKDDGLFWMSFEDFAKHFNSVSICYVRHKAYTKTPWNVERRKFYFDFDQVKSQDNSEAQKTIFQVRNPAYKLVVESEGEFCATVHQVDVRCEDSKPYIDVGVAVVQADPAKAGKYILMGGSGISADRQNQTNLLKLSPGEYFVVPITSGSKLRQDFEDRLIHDSECAEADSTARPVLSEVDANGVLRFTKDVLVAFRHVFQHLDVDGNGVLGKAEYDQYLMRTENSTVSQAAFKWLVDKFEKNEEYRNQEGLSQRAFIQSQLHCFSEGGRNEERLFKELKAIGFDNHLDFASGRSAAISLHGTSKFSFEGIPFDENLLTEAQEMVVAANGTVVTFDDERIKVYVYRAGYFGASFMVENVHTQPLVFTLDMTGSENVVSHRGSLVHTDVIPVGEKVVFHHLAPKDAYETWGWSYSANFMWDKRSAAAAATTASD